jgi:hypothetical protein
MIIRVLLSDRRGRERISRLLYKYGLIAAGRRDDQIAPRILDRHFRLPLRLFVEDRWLERPPTEILRSRDRRLLTSYESK